jgi:transcriptional regulator with XRE-family HTH domain
MAHAVDIYVGTRLKQRRVSMGMSQGELAEAVGITFQQVQKYERGANRMSASRLFEFSKVLAIPVGHFFEGMEEKDNKTTTGFAEETAGFEHEPMSGSRESLEFLRSFQRIKDPKQRKTLSAFVRSIAEGKVTHDE